MFIPVWLLEDKIKLFVLSCYFWVFNAWESRSRLLQRSLDLNWKIWSVAYYGYSFKRFDDVVGPLMVADLPRVACESM